MLASQLNVLWQTLQLHISLEATCVGFFFLVGTGDTEETERLPVFVIDEVPEEVDSSEAKLEEVVTSLHGATD